MDKRAMKTEKRVEAC